MLNAPRPCDIFTNYDIYYSIYLNFWQNVLENDHGFDDLKDFLDPFDGSVDFLEMNENLDDFEQHHKGAWKLEKKVVLDLLKKLLINCLIFIKTCIVQINRKLRHFLKTRRKWKYLQSCNRPKQCFTVLPEPNRTSQFKFCFPNRNRTEPNM